MDADLTAVPLFVRDTEHPSGHTIDLVAFNAIRMKHSHTVELAPAPKFGAHTLEVLRGLGLATEHVYDLLASGTVRESWGDWYLPD